MSPAKVKDSILLLHIGVFKVKLILISAPDLLLIDRRPETSQLKTGVEKVTL